MAASSSSTFCVSFHLLTPNEPTNRAWILRHCRTLRANAEIPLAVRETNRRRIAVRGEIETSPFFERSARLRVSVEWSASMIFAKPPTGTGSDLATAIRIVTCAELRRDVIRAESYSAVTTREVLRRLNAAQRLVPLKSMSWRLIF